MTVSLKISLPQRNPDLTWERQQKAKNLPWYAGILEHSDLPPIEVKIMMNNGGSLFIYVCHFSTTGKRSGIGGYIITPWKGILQGMFSRTCCRFLYWCNEAHHGRCLPVHTTQWKVWVDKIIHCPKSDGRKANITPIYKKR